MANKRRTKAAGPPGLFNNLLIATCRDHPADPDIKDFVPLPAGEYRLYLMRRTPDNSGDNQFTCTDATQFEPPQPVPALPEGDVIIVVHGFNCTESTGVGTSFNVAQSLQAWGMSLADSSKPRAAGEVTVIGFTWPCVHSLLPGYMLDKEAVARFASFSLLNLLVDLRGDEAQPKRRIFLVAHSMGCFLTLKALNLLSVLKPLRKFMPIVDDVIWLAPDIAADALECGTPDDVQTHGWRQAGQPGAVTKVAHIFHRPQPLTQTQIDFAATRVQANGHASAEDSQHALAGYGYASLNAMRRLHIYSSLRDEAMWISPLANLATEESGAADGGVRLGWCGPLHPGLMMIPQEAGKQRNVTLTDCSDLVTEHGDYFYHPVIQRDIAERLQDALQPGIFGANTFPERQQLPGWHLDTHMVYPAQNEPIAAGLALYQLVAHTAKMVDTTARNPTAPYRDASKLPTTHMWQPPIQPLSQLFLSMMEWRYHMLGQQTKASLPRAATTAMNSK